MRNERKYKIISLLTILLAVFLLGNCVRELPRMNAAVAKQHDEYVIKGAKVYAQNCVQCHGPRGEGVIGMPLNRKEFQVDYQSPAGAQQYAMLVQTIKQGRAGNAQHYQWEKTADNKWISYTAMPAWGRDFGGALDDDYVKAIALFIMDPTGEQWTLPGDTTLAPFQEPNYDKDDKGQIPLPDADVDPATNAAAKALLNQTTKTLCLTCHTVGSRGAKIGPDLTQVGSWGVDQKFLEDWIKYANTFQPKDDDKTPAMAHDVRMPIYWSANRANTSPQPTLTNPVISTGIYYMPRFKGKLTDEEISIIARYLMGLK